MFRFKRFTVRQGGAAMKVGTDGVLLGAWCGLGQRPHRILDIGTGTGVVALMIAQRGDEWRCCIDAVEIDAQAAEQAGENFEASPWNERLRVYNVDIQNFTATEDYDLIVSNPPFFDEALLPPDVRRATARHTHGLPHEALLGCVKMLLSADGIFSVVLPFDGAEVFIETARHEGLSILRRTDVCSVDGRPPKRSLLSFGHSSLHENAPAVHDELIIEDTNHNFTPEYRALTRDFYLKF